MLSNIKIEQDKEYPYSHKVYVDGKQIEKITGLNFDIQPCELPRIELEILSGIDFEGQAEVSFINNPFNFKNACQVLKDGLQEDTYLYDGFVSSIKSAISDFFGKDNSKSWSEEDLAKAIICRLVGDEHND